jgi:hypothetical protein
MVVHCCGTDAFAVQDPALVSRSMIPGLFCYTDFVLDPGSRPLYPR